MIPLLHNLPAGKVQPAERVYQAGMPSLCSKSLRAMHALGVKGQSVDVGAMPEAVGPGNAHSHCSATCMLHHS